MSKLSVVAFIRSIGSILSADAKIEVFALVAHDPANPPDQMSLERGQLMTAMTDLAQIEEGFPELEASRSAPYLVARHDQLLDTGSSHTHPVPKLVSVRTGPA